MLHLRSVARVRSASWSNADRLFLEWTAKRDRQVGKYVMSSYYFPSHLQKVALESPNEIAIKTDAKNYSYKELDDWTNQRARYFVELGVKPGDHIGIFSENSVSYLVSLFAANKIDAVPALVNKSLRGDALEYAIKSADCTLLHVDATDSQNEAVSSIKLSDIPVITELVSALPRSFSFNDAELSFSAAQHEISTKTPADKMALIYTSGTTGYPKPAIYTFGANLWASGLGLLLKWDKNDTLFTGCPLFHTLGSMMGATGIMWQGGSFACQTNFSASNFIADAIRFEATTISYVGEMLRYVSLTPPNPEQDRAHKIRNGFGPGLRPDVWNTWLERFGKIHFGELYGSSEGIVGLYNIDPDDTGIICRFTPLVQERYNSRLFLYDPETELPKRDEQGLAIPAGVNEPGILCSKMTETRKFRGYYKAKEKTSEKILTDMLQPGDEWFNTGDALYVDQEYKLRFMDRLGDTYRWRGENTSTEEVTNVITKLSFVADCAVYGVEVPGNEGKAGMAAIVPKNGSVSDSDLKELFDQLTSNLQKHSRPVFIREIDFIPKTANYKNRKVELVADGFNLTKGIWILQGEKYVPLTDKLADQLNPDRKN